MPMNDRAKKERYFLYRACFPEYPVERDRFEKLLPEGKMQVFERRNETELLGFAMLYENSVVLLCVSPLYRRQGIGSVLLSEAEDYIKGLGYDKVILGRSTYYLLQGVPEADKESVSFFLHRGYTAEWSSVNMRLEFSNRKSENVELPAAPGTVSFRFAKNAEKEKILQAVKEVDEGWLPYFNGCDPKEVFIADENGMVIGFALVSPTDGRFVKEGEQVGGIGCVGVVPAVRKRGIGRQMVKRAAEHLQRQGCTAVELLYVELVDWYRTIGFEVRDVQWMGEKRLTQTELQNKED